uniref:RIMS-binding protein 2 n=1 Tax=Arion vulgaris TaxID=1028688 RepID=A0A0B7AIF9_9EUPU
MDEDGFFDGELIDGRQGLVPSNFIEKVGDDDLVEFHAALLQAGHGDYSNANNNSITPIVPTTTTTSVAATTSNINNNNNDMGFPGSEGRQAKRNLQSFSEDNPDENFSDLEDIAEIDEDDISVNSRTLTNGAIAMPPCPRSLCLDRQLTNSILVSWRGPDPIPGLEIHSYNVLVDGEIKASVKSNERMKALLEGVNSNIVHRVCVRCVSNRGQSKDAQCTMLVGKDIYPVPSQLRTANLSSTSASLSWLPGNSNYQHSVIVNGKEVKVVKPGVFRHTLTGLVPGTFHKVTLIAKSISGALNEEKSRKWVENVSASIEFTTHEAEVPEPPLNIQVESGPREGTLLLTWLPVTINSSGVCNGAVVTGYHIMADSRKVNFVAGPTSDHVVLSSDDFKGLIPSQLSVRTVSASGMESPDSGFVLLPQSFVKEVTQATAKTSTKSVISKASRSPSSEEQKGHDTDEEIEEAFREAQQSLVEKVSPQPAPRKLLPSSVDTGPKEFHAQKPTSQGGKMLATPARIVPAIEIIRDSSTERGTSADEDAEEISTPSTRSTPTNISGKSRVPETGISTSYRGDAQNPSAFRQVDQTRHKDSADLIRRAGGMEPETHDKYDTQSKISKTQPAINHPIKTLPRDSTRAGRDSQSPSSKHKHNKTKGPWPDSAEGVEHKKHIPEFTSSPFSPNDDIGDTDSISGEINPVVDANTVRLFIALFDYDPITMSPNVDSIDEELPFREGQILKVFGDKDSDGFYKGESLGRVGYIPCNMVSEVQIDDPEIVEQLLQESAERLGQINTLPEHTVADDQPRDVQLTPNGVASIPREGPIMRRMIALYDYDPQELSPNVDAEMELSFKTGDIVMIFGDMDEDGFYTGEINGQQGLIPSNFLQPAPSSDDDTLESTSLVSATRSRSGESLDAALSALSRTEVTSNASKIGDNLPSSTNTARSNKQAMNVNFSDIKSEGSRPGTSSPADDEKPKKKGGFLNKSKNIFKKFTR